GNLLANPCGIRRVNWVSAPARAAADFTIPVIPTPRREAEAILSLDSSNAAGAAKSVLDFAANRAAATNDELGQYRIIHLATHGFLNSFNPDLSGLRLSLVDEKAPQANAFLPGPGSSNLKWLPTILSCSTA